MGFVNNLFSNLIPSYRTTLLVDLLLPAHQLPAVDPHSVRETLELPPDTERQPPHQGPVLRMFLLRGGSESLSGDARGRGRSIVELVVGLSSQVSLSRALEMKRICSREL
jgi:hypothetical protein